MIKKYFSYVVIASCIFFLLIAGCKDKPDDVPSTPNEPGEELVVIDSTTYDLISTEQEIADGTYRFSVSGETVEILEGEVIVGDQGSGFLRRVISVQEGSEELVLETEQASMEDLFETADFEFDVVGVNKSDGDDFRFDLENYPIIQQGALSITADGFIAFDSDMHFDFSFKDHELDTLIFEMPNAEAVGSLTLTASATQAIGLLNEKLELTTFKRRHTYWVPTGLVPIPVVVEATFKFDLKYQAEVQAAMSAGVTGTINNTYDISIEYEGTDWKSEYNPQINLDYSWQPLAGDVGATIKVDLIPSVEVKLYGVAGPYAIVELKEELKGKIASPSLDWDFGLDVWANTTIGAEAIIFGENVIDYNTSWATNKLQYRTPFSIEKVSGDIQDANSGDTYPIQAKVLDEFGVPQQNVPVYFTLPNADGSVSPASILTDENGVAETIWTLGIDSVQSLEVSARKADQTNLDGSPLSFNALVEQDSLQIGDFHEGGVIFYLDGTGGGLVASISELSIFSTGASWGCIPTNIIGADGTGIGTGAQNTLDILAGCAEADCAARLCANSTAQGYTDWFLPSKGELNEMYLNKVAIDSTAIANGGIGFDTSGCGNCNYWSSSESVEFFAWSQIFLNGNQASTNKAIYYRVRAVRSF